MLCYHNLILSHAERTYQTWQIEGNVSAYRSRQYREVDPRDSLHRNVEISQEDALGRPFGTITQPRIDSLSHCNYDHMIIASASNVKEAIYQVTNRLQENLIFNSFKHVDAGPCIIPEDLFPNRFCPTALYFGRWSTMDLNDTSHHSSQVPNGLWASPVCPRLLSQVLF